MPYITHAAEFKGWTEWYQEKIAVFCVPKTQLTALLLLQIACSKFLVTPLKQSFSQLLNSRSLSFPECSFWGCDAWGVEMFKWSINLQISVEPDICRYQWNTWCDYYPWQDANYSKTQFLLVLSWAFKINSYLFLLLITLCLNFLVVEQGET